MNDGGFIDMINSVFGGAVTTLIGAFTGAFMAAGDRVFVTIRGVGGHAARPHLSAVLALHHSFGVPGGFFFVGLPGFAVPYRDASDVTDGRTDEGAGFGLSI